MRAGKAAVRRATRIQELITVEAVVDGERTRGWVHTHGMDKLGLPELEIRDVTPTCLLVEASRLLNFVAQYVASAPKRVEVGDTLSFGLNPAECFRFAKLPPIPGEEGHYQVERWTLIDVEEACLCGACGAMTRACRGTIPKTDSTRNCSRWPGDRAGVAVGRCSYYSYK